MKPITTGVSSGIGLGWRIAIGALTLAALLLATSADSDAGQSPPAAPTNLQLRILADGLKITLFWDDNSADEKQFIVQRSSTGPDGPWGVAALIPADSTTHNDRGLSNNVTYWYRVAATNNSGTSDYSNVVSGTATAFPSPLYGDVDCNGAVTATDAAVVLQFHAGLIDTSPCIGGSDVNRDGATNAIDATLILQFVAGLADHVGGPPLMESGMRGLVTIGPICPVVQKGVPCPDLPFSATIVIEDAAGSEITRVRSADDGIFEIALAPGAYVLIPQSPNPGAPPTADELAALVRDATVIEVLIQYDSGIR